MVSKIELKSLCYAKTSHKFQMHVTNHPKKLEINSQLAILHKHKSSNLNILNINKLKIIKAEMIFYAITLTIVSKEPTF